MPDKNEIQHEKEKQDLIENRVFIQWLRGIYEKHNTLSDFLTYVSAIVIAVAESTIYYTIGGSFGVHFFSVSCVPLIVYMTKVIYNKNADFAILIIKDFTGNLDEKSNKRYGTTRIKLKAIGVISDLFFIAQIIAFLYQIKITGE